MEKVLIVEDEIIHQEMFRGLITLAYSKIWRKVEIVIAVTVMEALEHTQDAVLITLDANFPNDMPWSQNLSWMEVINSLNGRPVTLYPASSEPDNNEAMLDFCQNKKSVHVLRKNGKHAKELCDYIIKKW